MQPTVKQLVKTLMYIYVWDCVYINFLIKFWISLLLKIDQWNNNKNLLILPAYSFIFKVLYLYIILYKSCFCGFNVIHWSTCTLRSIHEYVVLYKYGSYCDSLSHFFNVILHPMHVQIYVNIYICSIYNVCNIWLWIHVFLWRVCSFGLLADWETT